MFKKYIGLSTVVFLLYVTAISIFATHIYSAQKVGHTQAQFEFEVLQMVAGISPDMSAAYVDSLKSSIFENERIAAVTIQKMGNTIFAYPLNKDFMGVNLKQEPIIQVSSPFIQTYSANFAISETDSAIITAAIYTVTPQKFESAIKIAFLLTFLGTFSAFAFAIYQAKFSSKTNTEASKAVNTVEEDNKETEESQNSVENLIDESNDTSTIKNNEISNENIESIVIDENIESIVIDEDRVMEEDIVMSEELYEKEINSLLIDDDNLAENETIFSETDNTPPSSDPEVENAIENIFSEVKDNAIPLSEGIEIIDSNKQNKQIDPMGLFSLTTGLGWESYFETRLDAELIRSTSSEQNLALFLIKVASVDHKYEIAANIAEVLTNHFNYRDLMFEYDSDGYAIIIPDIDFEQAMIEAESIYLDIKKIVDEARVGNSIGIGISSSAKRLITGSRLINEANLALSKSFEETELPIVAFRVNTDKYRKYINEELRLGLSDIKEEVIKESE